MKISLFVTGVFIFLILFACNDGGNNQPVKIPRFFEVKKVECESNVEACNHKPGIKFTALAPKVEDNRPNWRLDLRVEYRPDPYTLTICCDTIPRLIDSLNKMYQQLEDYRENKPETGERTCQLPDGITITVSYDKNLAGTGEFSTLEFGKVADGSVFYIYTKEQFDKLIEDINEVFKICCLN